MESPDRSWLGDRYELIEELGAGGMGRVWLARDTELKRKVAIKLLPARLSDHQETLARFRREAEMLAAVNHPGIATIHSIETVDAVPFLVMELVEGETLARRLSDGSLPPRDGLEIARQVAEALEAAHDRGIVHRDLKPGNVMFTSDDRVKLVDFGLALPFQLGQGTDLTHSPTEIERLTAHGGFVGTAPYMSPEQIRGKLLDRRTDIWAFGCILYELLTGRRAFGRETVADTLAAIVEYEPDWTAVPLATPPEIKRLLARCLDKDANRRLHDIADARIEIEDWLDGRTAERIELRTQGTAPPSASGDTAGANERVDGTSAWPTEVTAAAAATASRWPWAVAFAAVVVAAVAVALSVFNGGGSSSTEGASGQALRFTVPLSSGNSIGPGEVNTYLAVSPDGQRIVYAGNDVVPLMLHSLVDGDAEPIAGTEGGASPFWSPDGRFIAFFAEGQLKKVDLGGGPPQTICNASWEAGNSWGQGGTILFSQTFEGGPAIHRVSADGGDPEPLTRVDPEQEIGHFWPELLPDGRHFLFLKLSRTPVDEPERSLWIGSLDGGEPRFLAPIASKAQYSPTGHLLYVAEGILVARPFDLDRLAFTGDPMSITDELRYFRPTGQAEFALSRDGRVIAFHGGAWTSRLVAYGRDGSVGPEIDAGRAFEDVRYSPDGSRLAVSILDPSNGAHDLWIYDLEAATPRRLTHAPHDERGPVWSPDGTEIAFRSDANGPPDIYRRPADGSGSAQRVLGLLTVLEPVAWSASSSSLVYEESNRTTGSDLWLVGLDGESPRPLLDTRFEEWGGTLSPDGNWIAFVSTESGRSEVYVAPIEEPGARRRVSRGGGLTPRWRGSQLYYRAGSSVMAVSIRTETALEVGEPVTLFELDHAVYRSRYDVSPDGEQFLFNLVDDDTRAAPIGVIVGWAAILNR